MTIYHLLPRPLFALCCLCLFSWDLSGQVYEIQSAGKWGFMDRQGQLVVPPQYDFIYSDILSQPAQGLFVFQQGEKMGVYQSYEGEIIPALYDQIQIGEKGYFEIWEDGNIGLLDPDGQLLLEPEFKELLRLDSGLYKVKQDSMWGIWSSHNGHIIPPSFFSIELSSWGHLIGRTGSGFSVWDTSGRALLDSFPYPLIPLSAKTFSFEGSDNSGDIGLLSTNGEIVLPPQLHAVQPFPPQIIGHRDSLFGLFSDQGRQLLPLQYEKIQREGNALFWIKQKGLWGLADTSGKVLIEPVFFLKGRFRGPVAVVSQSGRYGLINRKGEFLTDLDCERIRIFGQVAYIQRNGEQEQLTVDQEGNIIPRKKSLVIRRVADTDSVETTSSPAGPTNSSWDIAPEPYGWFFDRAANKWGLLDSLQDTLIQPTFSEVYAIPRFNMSMVVLRPDFALPSDHSRRKCGLIDHRSGEYILNPVLNMIYIQDFARYPAARGQFSTRGFKLVSYRGQVYGPDFVRYMGPFKRGIARICQKGNIYAPFVSQAGKEPQFDAKKLRGNWSYMNLRGKVGDTPNFSYADNYIGSLALVKSQGKWGAINRRFQEIVPTTYDSVFYPKPFEEMGRSRGASQIDVGLLCAMTERKKYFFLNEQGNLAFSREYEAVGDFSEGLARFQVDGKWGYVNKHGEEIIPAKFSHAEDFHEGVANVRSQRKWGYIDQQGEWIVKPSFQQAGKMIDGVARVREGRRFGYIRRDGSWLVKSIYVEAMDFKQGIAIVRKPEKKFGAINRRGKWVLPQKFERISWIGEHLKVIDDKDLTGFYATTGAPIIRPQYEYVGNFHEGLARFKKSGAYGFMDSTLRVVIPSTYRSAGNFQFGLAVIGRPRGVGIDNWWGAIDLRGKEVVPMNNLAIDIRGYGNVWAERVDSLGAGWRKLDLSGYFTQQPLALAQINPHGVLFEKINRKYGYVNIHPPKDGMVIAETDHLLGLLDLQGKWLIEPRYESIQYRDGLYKIVNNGDVGYLDESGEWIWELGRKK